MAELFHYTDADGYKAIAAQSDWLFKAGQPPGDHPFGVYFTTLGPNAKKLAQRLGVPRTKLEYVFCCSIETGLKHLEGGRGAYIVYSSEDYTVEKARQIFHGPFAEAQERFR